MIQLDVIILTSEWIGKNRGLNCAKRYLSRVLLNEAYDLVEVLLTKAVVFQKSVSSNPRILADIVRQLQCRLVFRDVNIKYIVIILKTKKQLICYTDFQKVFCFNNLHNKKRKFTRTFFERQTVNRFDIRV